MMYKERYCIRLQLKLSGVGTRLKLVLKNLPGNGIIYYQIKSGDFIAKRKMIILKKNILE
jgi:hypothetical protein